MSDAQTIDDKVNVLVEVCAALSEGQPDTAGSIIERRYPFVPIEKVKRKYSIRQALQVFVHDGFINRFTGGRLISPPALRLISKRLPMQFPYHPNWRQDACHFAFWELFPTVDHIIPVSRGGIDDASNWVTSSMLCNSAKSNWTLSELHWSLHPPGNMKDWDGLLGWFMKKAEADPSIVTDSYLKEWHNAARFLPTQ